MGKVKSAKTAKKVLKGAGKVASVAANFVPGGAVVKGAVKLAGAAAQRFGGSRGGRRRSRGLNLNKYANRLLRAKLQGRIMREKLKVVNYIK